ncbi:MAG TPA: histidine phosphatase family protein [Alphaproteobacteria bacterium]|jgi:phosphohistidine phosphatase|nr:histidine phosphatase family protein [Alphaproteobacteria bacterium]
MATRLLLLLRHAKAAQSAADGKDHSRPLEDRGRVAAAAMGQWLAGHPKIAPELVLCSTAERTRETLGIVAEQGVAAPARFERELYLAEPAAILDCVGRVAPAVQRIMVVGHNPGIHELARALVGMIGARPAARLAFDRMRDKFPTGALAVIAFPHIARWGDVVSGKGRFESFTRPKDLA